MVYPPEYHSKSFRKFVEYAESEYERLSLRNSTFGSSISRLKMRKLRRILDSYDQLLEWKSHAKSMGRYHNVHSNGKVIVWPFGRYQTHSGGVFYSGVMNFFLRDFLWSQNCDHGKSGLAGAVAMMRQWSRQGWFSFYFNLCKSALSRKGTR